MIRWLAPAAVVVGLFLGIVLPHSASGNLTGAQLAVAVTPPTLSSGSSPWLTCGWHVGCQSGAGIALDFDDDNGSTGNPWHFRGFFYVSDANRTAFRMFPLVSQSGGTVCDIMTVWVAEIHSGQLMAIPTFMHVNITDNHSFDWAGGPWTIYNSRQIGTTINDTGCSWSGSHVHEYHVDYLTNLVTITRNTSVYHDDGSGCSGVNCCPGPRHVWPCHQYQNNYVYNWTRRFAWAEGAAPH